MFCWSCAISRGFSYSPFLSCWKGLFYRRRSLFMHHSIFWDKFFAGKDLARKLPTGVQRLGHELWSILLWWNFSFVAVNFPFGSLCTPIFSSSSHCAGKSCYILLGNSPNGARGPRLRRWLEPMAGRAVRGSRGLRQVQLWWFQSDSEEDKVQRRQSCKWYENTLNHLNHLNHLSRTACSIQFFGDASAGLLGVLAARTALRARKSQGGPAVPVFQGDKS